MFGMFVMGGVVAMACGRLYTYCRPLVYVQEVIGSGFNVTPGASSGGSGTPSPPVPARNPLPSFLGPLFESSNSPALAVTKAHSVSGRYDHTSSNSSKSTAAVATNASSSPRRGAVALVAKDSPLPGTPLSAIAPCLARLSAASVTSGGSFDLQMSTSGSIHAPSFKGHSPPLRSTTPLAPALERNSSSVSGNSSSSDKRSCSRSAPCSTPRVPPGGFGAGTVSFLDAAHPTVLGKRLPSDAWRPLSSQWVDGAARAGSPSPPVRVQRRMSEPVSRWRGM